MKKLAIISTHPIQYYAPVFKLLTERKVVKVKVFYTWEKAKDSFFDPKFKQEIKWDIPLLEGYEYTFVKNTSTEQGSHHRKGILNPTLNREVAEWQPDALLIFGWNFDSHFKAMRYFKGKTPVLFRGDSTLLDEKPGIKTMLRRIVLKFVYKYIDFAFYVGTNSKEYFLKHGLKARQLIFTPHAIDNERFSSKSNEFGEKAKKWKNELGIENDELVFLFAGKFEPKKDPLILLEATKKLQKEKCRFIFAGDGDLKKEMETKAKDSKNILFLPFQNQQQMPVLYRLADAFVLPSKGPGETWGLAVNEAMACGKAVLVSNKVGCAIDLVKPKENGYIFEAENPEDIILKLEKFDKQNIGTMGDKSKEIIANYSFSKICIAIEETLSKLNS